MAVDIFLKIDGIEGESQKQNHKGEIDIETFDFGAHQTGSYAMGGMGGGQGKAEIRDIRIFKKVDKSTPELFKACASGKYLPKAVITVQTLGGDAGPIIYYTITLEDVIVASIDNSGAASGEFLGETVVFNTAKVAFDYQPLNEKNAKLGGVIKTKFDLRQNKAG